MQIEKIVKKISLLHSISVETPTSYELAKEIIDHIEIDWSSPNLKIIDPACGRGTYLLALIEKLEQYHSREHIITNMIYGVDVGEVQYLISKQALSLACNTDTNLFNEDSLEKEWGLKFDLVLCSAPFNWIDGDKQRKNNRENLWTRFVTRAFEHLVKDNGTVAMVVPKTWMSPSKDYGDTSILDDYFRPHQVFVANIDECAKHYNTGSSFSYFVAKKDSSNSKIPTKIISENDVFEANLNDEDFVMGVPNVLDGDIFSVAKKFFNSSHTKFNWLKQYDGKVDDYKHKTGYTVFHTHASKGKTYSQVKSYLHDKKKVMVSLSGKFEPYYDYGNCSPSGMVICLLLSDNETLEGAKSIFHSKLYQLMVDKVFRYNGWINGKILNSLPSLNLSKVWTDQEIYDYFNLTPSEIKSVEKY